MMPVSHYLCIFINVGLGEAAKMPAATALASSAGNITIPVLIGGVQRTALLQWKTLSVPQSTDGNMVVVDGSWRGPVGDFELLLCHGTVCVVGKMRDLILQLSKSSIYSTKSCYTQSRQSCSQAYVLSMR
nr:hypothetical protein [Escherichia coli]